MCGCVYFLIVLESWEVVKKPVVVSVGTVSLVWFGDAIIYFLKFLVEFKSDRQEAGGRNNVSSLVKPEHSACLGTFLGWQIVMQKIRHLSFGPHPLKNV